MVSESACGSCKACESRLHHVWAGVCLCGDRLCAQIDVATQEYGSLSFDRSLKTSLWAAPGSAVLKYRVAESCRRCFHEFFQNLSGRYQHPFPFAPTGFLHPLLSRPLSRCFGFNAGLHRSEDLHSLMFDPCPNGESSEGWAELNRRKIHNVP